MNIMDILARIVSGLAAACYLGWIVTVIGAWFGAWPAQQPSQGLVLAMAIAAFIVTLRWTIDLSS